MNNNNQNNYADKIKAIKLKLQNQLKEKEAQQKLVEEIWGFNLTKEDEGRLYK